MYMYSPRFAWGGRPHRRFLQGSSSHDDDAQKHSPNNILPKFHPLGSFQGVFFFHFSPPWGFPKLGNFKFSTPWGLPKLGNFKYFSIPLFPQTLEKTAIYNVCLKFSMVQCRWPTQT